jgi:hypothetical protein
MGACILYKHTPSSCAQLNALEQYKSGADAGAQSTIRFNLFLDGYFSTAAKSIPVAKLNFNCRNHDEKRFCLCVVLANCFINLVRQQGKKSTPFALLCAN